MKRLFNSLRLSSKPSKVRRPQPRTLRFERMEDRQMMSVNPIIGGIRPPTNPVITQGPAGPVAEGSINFNASTGVVSIDASQTHDDTINIYINHRAGNGAGNLPDLLTVSLANINSPQVAAFDPAAVTKIIVTCHGGNDYVDNCTSVAMNAYGGTGNDVFFGGSGDDILIGGKGNNYLDGRGGDDTLFGGGGTNVMFGDDGLNSLYGGSGTNYMFGGSGSDTLSGGTGVNWMYGEGGTNKIISHSAADHIFANWGPRWVNVSDNGYVGFDWFDRYLSDPTVRSLARYDYYRDNALTRVDMLGIYNTIETSGVVSVISFDGTVSANELADLQALTSPRLNVDAITRQFAHKIAFGDNQNAYYQGAPLGNLTAGAAGDHLAKLVDKWFEGGDLPSIGYTGTATVQYQQVSGNLFGPNGPSYTDVAEGAEGDGHLMAALGEIAQHSPQTIESMFTDNGDGTYAVRFYDQNHLPIYVTVNRELQVDGTGHWLADWGNQSYDNPSNVLWVALAEKAFDQAKLGVLTNNMSYQALVFAQLRGASASDESTTASITHPNPQADFWKAFNQHKAMTLTSKASGTNSFIVTNQSYMVVGFSNGKYELYSPWGYDTDANHPAVVWETWAMIVHDFDSWTSVSV